MLYGLEVWICPVERKQVQDRSVDYVGSQVDRKQ